MIGSWNIKFDRLRGQDDNDDVINVAVTGVCYDGCGKTQAIDDRTNDDIQMNKKSRFWRSKMLSALSQSRKDMESISRAVALTGTQCSRRSPAFLKNC
jgi:hypothetical protein